MATSDNLFLPFSINVHTGRKEFSQDQLEQLKPKWYKQWQDYTDLSDEMIKVVVETIHTGPFMYPGTRIAEGAGKGMSKYMNEVKYEWKRNRQLYTSSQLYREAKKRLNNSVKRDADKREIPDPFAFEYFLPKNQRKMRRSPNHVA